MKRRTAYCPRCRRRDVKLSLRGRLKRHDGRAIGDEIWCRNAGAKAHDGAP